MKQETIILLAAVGAAAYFIYRKKNTTETQQQVVIKDAVRTSKDLTVQKVDLSSRDAVVTKTPATATVTTRTL